MATFIPLNQLFAVTVRRDLSQVINAFGGTAADLTDTIGDSFFGGTVGDLFIAGDDSSDTLNGSLGADTMRGGGGGDIFIYAGSSDITGDVIDGGAGIDEVWTTAGVASFDFTTASFAGTSGAAIERLNIFNATTQNVIFNASQFGGSGIATTLQVNGDGGTETVTINNASNFSAAGFTFSGWSSSDRILINGTGNADTITGSSQRDTITGGLGADLIIGSAGADRHEGGGGNDILRYTSQAEIANDTIDGGADIDELRTTATVASYDFTTATFAGSSGAAIERLNIFNSTTQNVIFNASQFGGVGIATALAILGDGGTETVTINNASDFSAAGFSFSVWNTATDRIVINGTGGADTITGSSQRDTITGGLGADTIRGSAGADRHEGGGGNDILLYESQAEIDGDTIDGGADVDQLRTTVGVASFDFTTATFAGSSGAAIDRLNIFNATTQNVIFDASQFGGAGIATALLVIGDDGTETVTINNATNFSAAGFTFSGWTIGTDRIVINGTDGTDSITGSSQRDTITGGLNADLIIGSAGADLHEGGGGDDILLYASQAEIDSDTIDGGGGVNELRTTAGVGTYDFTTATFAGSSGAAIAGLNIFNSTTQNVIFNASQFGGAGIATALAINGNDGTETVTINNASDFSAAGFIFGSWTIGTDRIVINGTGDADTITGSSQRDTISGGLGADTITGSAEADRHEGGAGNDVLRYTSQAEIANDTIDGGADVDELRTTAGVASYDFTTASFAGSSGAAIERLNIFNSTTQNVIFDASQFGGVGIATALLVIGDSGTETVTINNASNFSAAGFSFSVWNTATDRIVINGTGGADTITGSSQRDTITGGQGADLIIGSAGADRHESGGGDDALQYASQAEIDGDTIDGGGGVNELRTTAGVGTYDFTTATFAGSSGAAIAGLNIFNSTTQNVIFNASQFGGAGIATDLNIVGSFDSLMVILLGAETVTINNATNFSAAGFSFNAWDTATDRIVINGTGGADSITGSIQRDLITGGIGADTLTGGNADDTLDGGAGNDSLVGGAGIDMASYLSAGAAVTLNLLQGLRSGDAVGDVYDGIERFQMSNLADLFLAGNDAVWVDGADGADILYGGRGSDTLNGGGGNDFLLPDFPGTPTAYAADTIDGGAGFDAVYYFGEAVSLNLATGVHSGQATGDSFTGIEAFLMSEAADTLVGRDDAGSGDIFYGLGGADSMTGLGGFDYLLGGEGADTLNGGFGWDLLIGGAGADRFVYGTGGEGGVGEGIADFQVGVDRIAFVTASTGITGLTLGQNLFIQNSNVTTITGSQGTTTGPTLIYDTSNGALWYDANGNTAGGLIYLVGLSGAPVLTASDFMVV